MTQHLYNFFQQHSKLLVITGAGCSTDSGIPDYRDRHGEWKRKQPIYYQEFIKSQQARQRYWARSYIGWNAFQSAQPNRAHHAFAELEAHGLIEHLITQNVDGLHQKAGSQKVIDLHGQLSNLICLNCGNSEGRRWMQTELANLNPSFQPNTAPIAPDGDVDLEMDTQHFSIPNCSECDGILKPDVVFYGEQVPKLRIKNAYQALNNADAVLIAGTSLMVYSAYQFVKEAAHQGKSIAAINQGRTRADELIETKVEAPVGTALKTLLEQLTGTQLN